jgi:hypothetical protein
VTGAGVMRRLWAAALCSGATILAAVIAMMGVTSSAAGSESSATASPSAPLVAGPSAGSSAAAVQVATNWARNAGASGTVDLSWVVTSEAAAQQFLLNEPEEESRGPSAISQWHESATYLFEMTADGATFTDDGASGPPGSRAPASSDAELIVDAGTDQVVGVGLGSAPRSLASLGTVSETAVTVEAEPGAAVDISVPPTHPLGVLEGEVYLGAHRESGWQAQIRSLVSGETPGPLRSSRTLAKGYFRFTVLTGRYLIQARTPAGRVCGRHELVVRAAKPTWVRIVCGA